MSEGIKVCVWLVELGIFKECCRLSSPPEHKQTSSNTTNTLRALNWPREKKPHIKHSSTALQLSLYTGLSSSVLGDEYLSAPGLTLSLLPYRTTAAPLMKQTLMSEIEREKERAKDAKCP
ncbi:hypothetical protein MHYP_G00209530 [Metynnis hypsauchen]